MKHAYIMIAGLSLVALAIAPGIAGAQDRKPSRTLNMPSGNSVTVVATVAGETARRHIDDLSMQYTGHPYPPDHVGERVILKIAPRRQRAKQGPEAPPPAKR